jgi:phosphate uptake regulator
VFEEEPEDKPVNEVLDEMKSIVDRMIDDGLKMIEKRRKENA